MQGRLNPIESVLRRIEERLALWRDEQQARELKAEADRDRDCGPKQPSEKGFW